MQPDDPNEKWELPAELRITNPDVLKRAEKMQAELAARVQSPFGRLSPAEQARANAAVMVDHLKRDLERVSLQIKEIIVDGQPEHEARRLQELRDAHHHISARLAESYALVGRFDLAAELEPRSEMRTEYLNILKAINLDDAKWCECAPGRDFILGEVFSLRHSRMMPARKCSGCGLINVAPLPAHIAEQRAHRARARELVADKTPEEAKAILAKAGHTTERLIPK